MIMRGVCLVLIVLSVLSGRMSARAQLADDFSSGSFSTHGWKGDTSHFRFTSSSAIPPAQQPAVQLNMTASGTSLIYTMESFRNRMEWHAWIKLSFNPSASNFVRIYLTGTCDFPGNTDQAVFVGVGMVSDHLGLYQHQGSSIVSLLTDTMNLLNQSTNQVRVRVMLKDGWWHLEADYTGGKNLLPVDSVLLPHNCDTAMAGISCQYTSSNATKFYFDDIYCGPLITDTVPPALTSMVIRDQYQADLFFSEPLHTGISGDPTCFLASHNTGHPLLAFTDPSNPCLMHLIFGKPFPETVQCTLSLTRMADRAGNLMADTSVMFLWYTAQRNDLLIHEVMADPSPPVRLPDAEYIELYNRSSYKIALCDWLLWIDNTRIALPCMTIASGEYLILVNDKDTLLWQHYQGVVPLPKMQLRNEGACLALQDHRGFLIHAVCYLSGWHGTSFQAEGGYALELKDPENHCDQANTWASSLDINGGTPGSQNSFYLPLPDVTSPRPLKVNLISEDRIGITFSEPIDTTGNLPALFGIEGISQPVKGIILKTPLYDQMEIILPFKIRPDTVYHLTLHDTLKDCRGNYSLTGRFPFGIPVIPDSLDLLFNEIMYKPADNGVEYIEWMNVSGKIIDLSMCMLARIDTLDMSVKELYPVTDESVLVFPAGLVVITPDIQKLLNHHIQSDPSRVHLSTNMPSLPDQGGTYALLTQHGKIVDRMTYHPKQHAPVLTDAKGISLERLSVVVPTERNENWYSASAASGWGTPSKPNSQAFPTLALQGKVTVSPNYFSPYGSADNGIIGVYLHDMETGTLITISVYSEAGFPVKHLVRETVTGNHDMWPWDGTDHLGAVCPGGVYLVCVDMWHADSGSRKFRIPVLLLR